MLYAIAGLFTALYLVLMQADSTTVVPVINPVQWVVGYIFANVVPILTAWATKKYNLGQSAFARLSNGAKMGIYVVVTVALMYLFRIIGLGWDRAIDVGNLGPDLIAKIVQALVATGLVKIGITTGRAKPIPDADSPLPSAAKRRI